MSGEIGAACPNCGEPVRVGQVVLPWPDAGEMHVNCRNPYALTHTRRDDEPTAVVLIGSPMTRVLLSDISKAAVDRINAEREWAYYQRQQSKRMEPDYG